MKKSHKNEPKIIGLHGIRRKNGKLTSIRAGIRERNNFARSEAFRLANNTVDKLRTGIIEDGLGAGD